MRPTFGRPIRRDTRPQGGGEEAERRRKKKFVDLRSNPVFEGLSRVGPQERGRKLLGEASEK